MQIHRAKHNLQQPSSKMLHWSFSIYIIVHVTEEKRRAIFDAAVLFCWHIARLFCWLLCLDSHQIDHRATPYTEQSAPTALKSLWPSAVIFLSDTARRLTLLFDLQAKDTSRRIIFPAGINRVSHKRAYSGILCYLWGFYRGNPEETGSFSYDNNLKFPLA